MTQAAPSRFDIPAQGVATALLAFSAQSGVEVLFASDDLDGNLANAVSGTLEPIEALNRLLQDTPFVARRSDAGKFIIARATALLGDVRGRLRLRDGSGAAGVVVNLAGTGRSVQTDAGGRFHFPAVPADEYVLITAMEGFRPLEITGARVSAGRTLILAPQWLEPHDDPTQMAPFVVAADSPETRRLTLAGQRRAIGNLDLGRTEDDVLPFIIHTRKEITRSGVIGLNEFLQRVVLESDAAGRPPEQDVNLNSFAVGSTNLKLRGYGSDETVVLVNGRRLPEVLNNVSGPAPPDVNFIPVSLVQQIEVLPASASALYGGNPVGGVINIVLRPEADATEVTTTYINALSGYDAPQTNLALQHGQSLLDGKLRLRLSASFSETLPPTESELNYRQKAAQRAGTPPDPIFRATPNVVSASGQPLFGPGTATYTSVAPDADGNGGLAAFAGRAGERSLGFFDSAGGLAASLNSLDSPYARKQRRATWFGSIAYDLFPWLELGVDGAHVRTTINRGYDVFTGDLLLAADSPFNPFGEPVYVTLNETAPRLGQNHSEARIEYTSLLTGALLRLPGSWQLSLDAQIARNLSRYRGLAGADLERWQQLVDGGRYNPLRDTQVHAPPAAFYDEVLIHHGSPSRFVKVGDYATLDASARILQPSLPLPTGVGALNLGADYRRNRLRGYRDERRYADGSLASPIEDWSGRTLERYSFFGEIQAPLLPQKHLPAGVRHLEGSVAVRYLASDQSNEVNVAPTFGLKVDFTGGFSLRGSLTTSNRMPTPVMSRRLEAPGQPGSGLNLVRIFDPVRAQSYDVQASEALDFTVNTEEAVTQTAGVVFQRGHTRRFRVSLDFVDTTKTNEILGLDAQPIVNLETLFPDRVVRAPLSPGDPLPAGVITTVHTGSVNASSRHSQSWTASVSYAHHDVLGGTLELRGRLLYFQRYTSRLFANTAKINQLDHPDGSVAGLMRYRANFGATWSTDHHAFGVEGQYFHSRKLPVVEWPAQGSSHIKPYWQFDAFVQTSLRRWLPWLTPKQDLVAQLRVNNVLNARFPHYTNEPSGTGIQPYGDWRRQTYSLSLTATF